MTKTTTTKLWTMCFLLLGILISCSHSGSINPETLISSSQPSDESEDYYLGRWEMFGIFKMTGTIVDENTISKWKGCMFQIGNTKFSSTNEHGYSFESFQSPKISTLKLRTSEILPGDFATTLRNGTSLWWGLEPKRKFFEKVIIVNPVNGHELHFERLRKNHLLYFTGGWFVVFKKK